MKVAVGLSVIAGTLWATQAPPARTVGVTVAGRVVLGVTKQPIADAGVRLINRDSVRVLASTRSHSDGTFEFASVADGRYEVEAWKEGYIRGNLGQRGEMDRGHVLVVVGSRIAELEVPIWKQATISGHLSDDSGRPMPSVIVHTFAEVPIGGRLSWMHLFETSTDKAGTFKVHSLPQGRYLVVAGQGPPERLSPTFFPSVGEPAAALPIELAAGEDRTDLSIRMTRRTSFVVKGRILPVESQPIRAHVRLVQPHGDVRSYFVAGTARIESNGSFVLPNIPVGDYLLELYLSSGTGGPTWSATAETKSASAMILDSKTVNHGPQVAIPITVRDEDVVVAPIPMPVSLSIRGRLAVDPRAQRALDPLPTTALHAVSADGHFLTAATRDSSGRFTISGLAANKYFLRFIGSLPAGWAVSDVTIGGQSAMELPVTLNGADIDDAVVYLTDRLSDLSGLVTDRATGASDPHAVILVFPTDRRKWTDNGRNPPWIRNARTDAGGQFSVRGLPRGEYFVVSLRAALLDNWETADNLARLAPLGIRVTIVNGQKLAVSLNTTARLSNRR